MRNAAKEKQILICVKRPGQDPVIEPLFENSLRAFQEAVGGYIETVTICSDLCLIINEEGRLLDLPYNATILGHPFVGPVLAAGIKGDEFSSLKASNIPAVLQLLRGDRED